MGAKLIPSLISLYLVTGFVACGFEEHFASRDDAMVMGLCVAFIFVFVVNLGLAFWEEGLR